MQIAKVIVASFASLTSLFVFTKLMGNRQMSQLGMFDYISSIALGSIAGEMAVMSTDSIIEPLAAMIVFVVVTMFINYITCKSIILRRFFEGQAILLYQKGQIFEKNLLKANLDIDELLSLCRISGYFDLEEVHTVYMETNGTISILPMSDKRPATPGDLNIQPQESTPLPNVIIDGNIMKDNLLYTGKNEVWVQKQLKKQGIDDIKEIILATYDKNKDALNIYKKYHKKVLRDIFE